MVLPGASERDLDAAAGASGGASDGNGAQKAKALGLAAGVRRSGSSGGAAGNAGHDRLLRCRCADRVRFLHFPGPEMVVPAGTGADPVLDQRGASGRADVPHPAVRHGV